MLLSLNTKVLLVCLLITLLGLINKPSFTQGRTIHVKGTIKELNSSVLLPFANVAILNTTYGTMSNEAGNFELTLPANFADSTLLVSYVGYVTAKIPLSNLVSTQSTAIELAKETRLLKEILVTNKKLDAKKIVMKAMARIAKNYISHPHTMEAFYREQVFNAEKNSFNLLECVVDIEDPGIRRTDSLVQIRLKEMRKGSDFLANTPRDSLLKSFFNNVFTGHATYNSVYILFGKNYVRTYDYRHRYDQYFYEPILKPSFTTHYEFELADYWIDNGVPIYEINFSEKKQQQREYTRKEFNSMLPKNLLDKPSLNLDSLYELQKQAREFFAKRNEYNLGKIYINAEDYGIVKLVFGHKILAQTEWVMSRTEIQYAKYSEKYCLKFISDVTSFKNKTGEKYNVKQLQINVIKNSKSTPRYAQLKSSDEVMGRWDDLWSIKYVYHPSFWTEADNRFLANFDISKIVNGNIESN